FSSFTAPQSTQPALDQPPKPTCNPVGARPRATRFVDSKGHSRFVLRILIILSQPEPQTRARRIAVHVVGTVIAHIAKTAMYAPPGIGSSRLPASSLQAADETREGRKGRPLRQTARGPALFERVGSHGWRVSQPWAFLPVFCSPLST